MKEKRNTQKKLCPICNLPLDKYDHSNCDKKISKIYEEELGFFKEIVYFSKTHHKKKKNT